MLNLASRDTPGLKLAEKNSILSELRKRKVVQAAAIYGAIAWGVTEVVVTVVEQLFLPQWVSTLAVIFFVVGFPIAMFLSWTFDLTTEGIRRTEVTSRRGTASIVISMVMLLAGTAGLFFLIKPGLQTGNGNGEIIEIAPNSIAVLPFADSGVQPDDGFLVEGLGDELRDQLARVSGLRIAARSSSVAAFNQGLDALSTAQKLGVANILEGNVRRQGRNLRVSVQLIGGRDGLAAWSETFERGPNELLNIQQAIVEAVVSLVLPDSEAVLAAPATRDVNANELMLLARHYQQQVRDRQVIDREVLLESVRLYREATEADPESALAHSRLATGLMWLGDLEAAEAPIFKAMALDPNLSDVQNTLGEFYWARGLPDARTAFVRAIELNPNNADALHNLASWSMLSVEWHDHGVDKLFEKALELDPLSLNRYATLGEFYGLYGYADEVQDVIARVRELFNNAESNRLVGWLNELIGEVDRAIAWVIRARDLEPENHDHVSYLADLYANIGDFETALQLEPEPGLALLYRMRRYTELIDQAEFLMIEEPEDMGVRYLLAFAYQATGQYESAIHVLGSTGLPDSLIDGIARSTMEIEAFITLFISLAGIGRPDTDELARSLADWFDQDGAWWGDIGWIGIYRGCTLEILGRREEALQSLVQARQSIRLIREPIIRDINCLKQLSESPEFQEILDDQENRRSMLRERLPSTLAEFRVSLD